MQLDILVAVDQSEESHNALVNALDIVSSLDGTVIAVHVVDNEDTTSAADSHKQDQGEAILRDAVERAANWDISIETELLVGDPIEVIADYAENNDIDVIYVGHRGLASEDGELSGERRGPLGSVAKGLIKRTQTPVSVFDRGL